MLPFDALAALAYGRIIAQCGWARGRDYDRMIAAHAISSDSILVTHNKADFRDIPGSGYERLGSLGFGMLPSHLRSVPNG